MEQQFQVPHVRTGKHTPKTQQALFVSRHNLHKLQL